MIRAVLDVNVLVSAIFTKNGPPGRLLNAWDEGYFDLVVSPKLLEELTGVLIRPRIQKRIPANRDSLVLQQLRGAAKIVGDPSESAAVQSADSEDNYLIDLASDQRAALVSGDHHLTDLRGTIPVFSPAEFLDYLAAA